MTKRVAIYTRVSTDTQTTVNQERELRVVAERATRWSPRRPRRHGMQQIPPLKD